MLSVLHHGLKCKIHMSCDSSAARGMSVRQGWEKSRPVDVRFLWVQQAAQKGLRDIHEVRIPSSCGSLLPADELLHGRRWQ